VDDVRQCDPSTLNEFERGARRSLLSVALGASCDARPAIGLLQLRDRVGGDPFTAGDLKLAQAVASQAAVLIHNSRLVGLERELQIARNIQQSLLPGEPPRVPGVEIAGACVPASNVGGDYFDYMIARPGEVAFLVADVSGHNLAAGLMQTAARAAFRAASAGDPAPAAVLGRTGRSMYDDLSRAELFLTAWLGLVDGATGRLTYADAGHNAAILHRAAAGETTLLESGGIPIGVLADTEYDECSVVLEPGDVLVVYTDGLTEAEAPGDAAEQYGLERLRAAVARCAAFDPARIASELLLDVSRFCGGRPAGDDRSVLVVRRT
jgi:serine phosphatase RsbU (regulator of sigma subunit)